MFEKHLYDRNTTFAIKLAVGAAPLLFQKDAIFFAEKTVPLTQVLPQSHLLEEAIRAAQDDAERIQHTREWLLLHTQTSCHEAELARQIVAEIEATHSWTSVKQIAHAFSMTVRSLQRLFQRFVGASPKWVIQRYRLHEAMERITQQPDCNRTELALALGYFDQSHFLRDFKMILGISPGEYAMKQKKEKHGNTTETE
jgi:AraC-like DNA-binding protein